MIRSPSFSRSASSTTMTILPFRKSATTDSMELNFSVIYVRQPISVAAKTQPKKAGQCHRRGRPLAPPERGHSCLIRHAKNPRRQMKSRLDRITDWDKCLRKAGWRPRTLARNCRLSERELRRFVLDNVLSVKSVVRGGWQWTQIKTRYVPSCAGCWGQQRRLCTGVSRSGGGTAIPAGALASWSAPVLMSSGAFQTSA